jgi:hypothetical protein
MATSDRRPPRGGPRAPAPPAWTFLTNHGHVLVCIAQNPDVRLADIADIVGIGERATHRIVSELVDDGYVVRSKRGRRNSYAVDFTRPLRHPLEAEHSIGEVFRALTARGRSAGTPGRPPDTPRRRS